MEPMVTANPDSMCDHTGRLFICGADEVDRYRARGITHLIRIVNPGFDSFSPEWFTQEYLQLAFGDVVSEADAKACRTKAPDLNDIRRAIVFSRMAFRDKESRLLISCDYGASRSPALAFVILSDQMGPGLECQALEEILRIRPDAVPNSIVVMIGDRLLGRQGNLMDALRILYGDIQSSLELIWNEENTSHDQ